MAKIQVLIAAYGPNALEHISNLRHPEYPEVEYIVGWQKYDRNRIPDTISTRSDFKILFEESIGLCNNRNELLEYADADYILISDDDLEYSTTHFVSLFKACEINPDCHFLCFKYHSEDFPKTYPSHIFDLNRPPKGYFVTSMELCFNMKKIRNDFKDERVVWFNPAFGINGSSFICGEEDILVHDILKKGMTGRFIPVEICINSNSTTSDRIAASQSFIETKGAVIRITKPRTWFLRMITHAWRSHKMTGEQHISFLTYCKWWLTGVKKQTNYRF